MKTENKDFNEKDLDNDLLLDEEELEELEIEEQEDFGETNNKSILINIKEIEETALLVSIETGEFDVDTSFDELEELALSAGVEVAGRISQKRRGPNPASYVGKGKLEEIKEFAQNNMVNLLIFNHELSAPQIKNIEDATDVRTIDRTMLILDIFSSRANTGAGRIQVELAQQKYMLPRLIGMGKTLSRQAGGGSGGAGARRGGGEQKLEIDRRHIRRRIEHLESQLKNIEKNRYEQRQRRQKSEIPTIAIVGYTNVGKSTLLNKITQSDVYVEDKLFATLDPTTRRLVLPDGRFSLMTDTVGLVRRLPHHLVEAFKSTLEEALYADVILNVCDASSEEAYEQIRITEGILKDIGVKDTPVITVFNKADLVDMNSYENEGAVYISALRGLGIDLLLNKISENIPSDAKRVKLLIPYTMGPLLSDLRDEGKLYSEVFEEKGILVDLMVISRRLKDVEEFIVK